MATKLLIRRLIEDKAVPTAESLRPALVEIMRGEATQAQIGALMIALRMHPISAEMLDVTAATMLEFANPCNVPHPPHIPTVDIVGTGGDGLDTFNVSTAASFVVAACGAVVAKHGNRSASGAVGSADFLEALGCRIDLNTEDILRVIAETQFGFLFAQMFHPAMKHVGAARREVGVKTVFNLLGPLTNPARPRFQVIGVGQLEQGELFANLFALRNTEHALIVHSFDGLDELSPATSSHAWVVKGREITKCLLHPTDDFGLPLHTLESVSGGTPADRAASFRRALLGETGPIQDFILLNAAAALWVAGLCANYKAGVEMAREAIASGKAASLVDKYVALSQAVKAPGATSGTVLERIAAKRRVDVEESRRYTPLEELKRRLPDAPSIMPFDTRLIRDAGVAVIAEIKRASPSKGDIAPGIVASEQGLEYAHAGAAAISVLTEPSFFKGTLQDMEDVRKAIDRLGQDRPSILRKDFIVDEYQIYEARVAGADTVLLIVTMLTDEELRPLLACARELGMEPLVEVATAEEMQRAVALGSKVIGVNNRDLHNFSVDMSRTERVVASAGGAEGITMIALSGISSRVDVQRYTTAGARAVLVGEALMRAEDSGAKVRELRGFGTSPLVKICGLKDAETAVSTVKAGADFIGLVFAAKSPRCVTIEQARTICDAVHSTCIGGRHAVSARRTSLANVYSSCVSSSLCAKETYVKCAEAIREATATGPMVVGVFADQEPEEVLRIATEAGLDIIQLSGKEGMNAAAKHPGFMVIKAVHVGKDDSPEQLEITIAAGGPSLTLLDTKDTAAMGGTGRAFDWSIAAPVSVQFPLFLAGGLEPGNIAQAVQQVKPFGVDVSSGVETAGQKEVKKIQDFVANAKK